MKIRHMDPPLTGQEAMNTFVAYDDVESELGYADVVETMRDMLFPSRPHQMLVRTQCAESARDALIGAATARAMLLARLRPGTPARIYTEVDLKDEGFLEMLRVQGYKDDDALLRMTRQLKRGPVIKPLMRGLVVVRDYLIDETEGKYFVQRYNAVFSETVDDQWLRELKSRPNFCRFIAVAQDGLAGELVTWSDGNWGVVGVVQTPPNYQRRGIASHLIEQARCYWVDMGLSSAYFDVWSKLNGATRLAATSGFRQGSVLKRLPGIDVD